ncbi:unnamed protein product [Chilo suppressalis]|uniref:AN1-type domain-containing protein n=1 Tax=Chilo suppressalis TaxID=168631 RepID=A0ABN8AWY8_CHISP|nr:unnamed protein product [Chilo suppressalis]
MENDPSKKESKVKRILKKAIRRNSKASNNSQSSAMEQTVGVSRSKSFENKHMSIQINDSTPLPTPDGTKETIEHSEPSQRQKTEEKLSLGQNAPIDQVKLKKIVEIQENKNEFFEEAPSMSKGSIKSKNSPRLEKQSERYSEPEPMKKNLKRKLEEESGAGTSGTSTGTSDTDADDKDPSKDKKKKNRCAVCRKKVGLTGSGCGVEVGKRLSISTRMELCRCGGLFCAVHRYSDKHECSFDYRELGAQEIRRNNPVVVSQKIHKI